MSGREGPFESLQHNELTRQQQIGGLIRLTSLNAALEDAGAGLLLALGTEDFHCLLFHALQIKLTCPQQWDFINLQETVG